MRAQEFITENMDHSQDGRAVAELRAALLAKKNQLQSASDDQVYDIIDKIMTRIARSHSISGQKLHDMWVDRYKQIPDTWIMNENTEQKPVIIYTNHRGATIDDNIKNSLPVTQIPVDKLRLWEKHKSMQDPKVADWVTNKLLPELKQNGKLKPLLVWNNNGQFFVIDGNHRLIAYQEAGYKGNVPVQIVPDNMITVSDTVPGQQGVAENKQPGKPVVDAILKVMPLAQEIWFHGSRAIGQHRNDSDTDILVVVPDDLVGDKYLGVVRILQKLSSHFDNHDIQPTKAGTNIHRIAQEEGRLLWSKNQGVTENFADGRVKGKSRPGRVKRAGASCAGSVTDLRAKARKYGGERGKMYHWCANMKGGKK
jgi:predicted nucleotidyltransferase